MPVDASIYGQIQQPKLVTPVIAQVNPLEQLAQAMQVKGAMNQNELAQYTLKKSQRADEETNALSALLKTPGFDLSTPEGQRQAYSVAPTVAPGAIKQQLEAGKLKSEMGKNDAQAGHFNAQTQTIALQQHRDALAGVNDPAAAAQWLHATYADPRLASIHAATGGNINVALQSIPQDPAAFQQWKQQNMLGAEQMMKYTTPDANARLQSQTSIATNAATNATSRANNRDTNAAHLTAAGMTPGGGLDENAERTAQAIASGQLPAPTGMALLNPKNQRILGRVMEINPQYDSTTVDAKKKAARDFTSGNQGNAMRSFQVAGQHLDQLGQLVDALDNGNMQVVNKLGNAIATQTGSPAPTNFEAAKDVVSKEVIKAIVGAGAGGVAERQELAHLMDNAKSPAQLKGVIAQYRTLMAAQHDALLAQRRAAGLPDSTLPNYTEASGSAPAAAPAIPAAPAAGGWSYVGKVK